MKGSGVEGEVEGEGKDERNGEGRGRGAERTFTAFYEEEGIRTGGRERGDWGGSG